MQNPKDRNDGGHKSQPAGTTPAEPAITGVVETVKDRMHDMATGVSDLVAKTKDTAQGWASSAADAAVQAKNSTVEMASTAAHRVGDVGKDIDALIHRYPIQTLFIGLGVGFLLGQITYRRPSPRS